MISFTTFLRDNLEYHCLAKSELESGLEKLVSDLKEKKLDGVAVVYCMTTKSVEGTLVNLKYKMKLQDLDTNRIRKYHGKVNFFF